MPCHGPLPLFQSRRLTTAAAAKDILRGRIRGFPNIDGQPNLGHDIVSSPRPFANDARQGRIAQIRQLTPTARASVQRLNATGRVGANGALPFAVLRVRGGQGGAIGGALGWASVHLNKGVFKAGNLGPEGSTGGDGALAFGGRRSQHAVVCGGCSGGGRARR